MGGVEPIKVAFVGSGGIAKRYRRTYAALENVRVVLTMDLDEVQAREGALETGSEAWTTSFSEVLTSGADMVVISTPNHLHREHACAVLGAGKHVLLQKPMARTVEEAQAIVDAASASGKSLGIYMNLLDHPLAHDIFDMVRLGYLGQVGLASARLAHRGGLHWRGVGENWRASKEETGGGSFIQLAVHYLNLIQWVFGDRARRVQAFSKNFACQHLQGDDLTLTHFEFENGAYADVQTSWCLEEEHISFLGTKGSIHYRDNRWLEVVSESGSFDGRVVKLKGNGRREVIDPLMPPEWDDAKNPFNQHRRFVEALQRGRRPDVDANQGLEDVRLVQACEESALTERVVYIKR